MPFKLRDNQEDTISKLIEYLHDHNNRTPKIRNPLISAPVAFGKSICIAEFAKRMIQAYPNTRILNMVHVKELVDQNHDKFKLIAPAISNGVYMAALGQKDYKSQVIYGSVHSVFASIELFSNPDSPIDILVVDECHWIQKSESGMYRAIIDSIRKSAPHLVVIGWTGTAWRMDGGPLAEGDNETRLFDDIYHADTIRGMLDKGYHSPLVVPEYGIQHQKKTSAIPVNNDGHQSERAMAKVMDGDMQFIHDSVDEYVRLSNGRKKHLIFGTTIKHCEHLKESFSRYYRVEFIKGSMSDKVRESAINDYKEDRLDMLISGMILTTGFDEPRIDCIGLFRSVSSSALYTQIAGRGLRIHSEKENCLWLDFTSTTEMHGPVDEVQAPVWKEKGTGSAVVKQCGNCNAFVPASARECRECGVEFEMHNNPSHEDKASTASILGKQEPITARLTDFKAHRHTTTSGAQTVKLIFSFGLSSYTFIMNLEGKGRFFACKMWESIVEDKYKKLCPNSAENALMLLNEQGVFNRWGDITFEYENYYSDSRGKRKKLRSPRVTKIL